MQYESSSKSPNDDFDFKPLIIDKEDTVATTTIG